MPDVVRNGCELAHILEFVSNKPHLAKSKPSIHQRSFIYQNRKHFRKNNKKISFANALILKEGTKIGDLYPSLIRGSLGGLESPGIIDTSRT